MPDGPQARRFAQRLVDITIENWQVVGGGGAALVYREFTFTRDGRWDANAVLEADFEEIPCFESGIWRIAETQTPESAIMEWDLTRTSCPTRETGGTTRVQISLLKDGRYKIAFR
jgi:hypothetical protein